MNWAHTTTRTIDLGYEQLLTLAGRPGTRVRVLFGSMWLTQQGCEQDVVVSCGDEVTLHSGGLAVIEGLGAARVQVIEPAGRNLTASLVRRGRHVWQALRARAASRDVLARSVILLLAVAVSMSVLHLAAPGPLAPGDMAAASATHASRATGAADALSRSVANARAGFLAAN
ncbi:MAG TPA: DUF2917 domain-containing protein [Burkholderiaceae bacterium]|nr:DUF2917 domain-containing protein [Burkholderiaceae bacterium]